MAAAIPALMIGGAMISAVGAVSAAKAQSQAASYNATIAGQNAQVALDQASADVAMQRKQAAQTHDSLIATTGASGVTMEGSPSDVLAMSVTNAALDEATLKYRERLKATGFFNEQQLDEVAGKTATQQGYMTAASSLLTGAGAAGHSYVLANRGYSQTIGPA